MRWAFNLFMLALIIYFVSDPTQASHDISTLINHAMPFVKQLLHSVLNFLQSLRR